jgi:hypothetical protein
MVRLARNCGFVRQITPGIDGKRFTPLRPARLPALDSVQRIVGETLATCAGSVVHDLIDVAVGVVRDRIRVDCGDVPIGQPGVRMGHPASGWDRPRP